MATVTGLLTKDITLGYKSSSSASTYTTIDGLQSVPAMGATMEKVEVTCLDDANKRYIKGIGDFGDLEFGFLYDNSATTSNYRVLKGLETGETVVNWEVTYPDGTKFDFTGQCTVATAAGEVNAPITFTLTIALNSDITVVNPTTTSTKA